MSDTLGMEYGVIDSGLWVGCVKRDALTGNARSICTHWCVYRTAFRADLIGRNVMILMWYTRDGGWRIEEWARHSCGE
jgi:hypothetical protein